MRHEALFRRRLLARGLSRETARKYVAQARRAERLLGLELDDWRERAPRAEPTGRGSRQARLAADRYVETLDWLDEALEGRAGAVAPRREDLLAALRDGAAELGLEPCLAGEAGAPGTASGGAPLSMVARGRDGARAVVHLHPQRAGEAELAGLLVAMRVHGEGEGFGGRARGVLAAGSFDAWTLEAAAAWPGVRVVLCRPAWRFEAAGAGLDGEPAR